MYIDTQDHIVLLNKILKEPPSGKGIFFAIGANSSLNIDALIIELNKHDIPFLGGVFPLVLSGTQISSTATVYKFLEFGSEVFTAFPGTPETDQKLNSLDHERYMILYDYNNKEILPQLEVINELGLNFQHMFGGGAGRLNDNSRKHVFYNEGFFSENGILLVGLNNLEDTAYNHGWSRLETRAIATKNEASNLIHINWESAASIYLEQMNAKIDDPNLPELINAHPLGICEDSGECKVRDVLGINDEGHLILSAPIDDNTTIEFLKGDKKLLLAATVKSFRDLIKGSDYKSTFMFNCVGRYNYSQKLVGDELESLTALCEKWEMDFEGVLSLGEININNKSMLEYYNKSVVFAAFS